MNQMPTTCLLWERGCTDKGYGLVWRKRNVYAHREAWENHNGKIPIGLLVLHKCDNPRCVNPDHLFLGTHLDNARDRGSKGRDAKGSRNGMAKLTHEQANAIRADLRRPFTIAKAYGVPYKIIWRIKTNRAYND